MNHISYYLHKFIIPSLTGGLLLFVACSSPSVPASFTESDELPSIYPDYVGVTVPQNIAPLHFHIDHDSTFTDFVTRFAAGEESWNIAGEDVRPGLKKWNEMKAAALDADRTPISATA